MSELEVGCTRSIEIFAAASSGCIALAKSTGLPLACVRASVDADAAIGAMNEAAHGAAQLWADSFQPFEPQKGWRDWRCLPFEDDSGMPHETRIERGRIRLDLPAGVATAAFEAALHAELARCRFDAVTTSPAWLIARSDAGQPLMIPPRYTLVDENDFRRGATKAEDLFVLEPLKHATLVARLARRARARARARMVVDGPFADAE